MIWGRRAAAVAAFCAACWALGCGGAPPPKPPADPYGPRIAQCIDSPRGLSDAAIDHMVPMTGFKIDRNAVTNAAYAEIVPACGIVPPDADSITPRVWAELAQRFKLRASYAEVAHFLWSAGGPPAPRADEPMVLVTYEEAAFYCAWRGGRLPTADEWQRALGQPGLSGNLLEWTSTHAEGRDGQVRALGGGASRVLPVDQRDINLGFRCSQ